MTKTYSPIVVFTFLRLQKLKKIVDTLKKCKISKDSVIYFFSDFAINNYEIYKVKKVREYLNRVTGFKKKKYHIQKKKLWKWQQYYQWC